MPKFAEGSLPILDCDVNVVPRSDLPSRDVHIRVARQLGSLVFDAEGLIDKLSTLVGSLRFP